MSNSTAASRPSAVALLMQSAPEFVKGAPIDRRVSLLGQAIADVLTSEPTDEQLRELIETFENLRVDATSKEDGGWNTSIVGFLGLLRQLLHNRRARVAASNPTSVTLREKVRSAVDAGVDSPTEIAVFVDSPPTVVSRVLRRLVDDGLVQRVEPSPTEDGRLRRYATVPHQSPMSKG